MQAFLNVLTGVIVGLALFLLIAEKFQPLDSNLSMSTFYSAF